MHSNLSFKEKVLKNVKKIPYGKVTTYGTIALLSGSPRGAKIVGGILRYAKEDIPWHRVINSQGFLSIKNLEYPKEMQKSLLISEGIEVSRGYVVDLKKYGWLF